MTGVQTTLYDYFSCNNDESKIIDEINEKTVTFLQELSDILAKYDEFHEPSEIFLGLEAYILHPIKSLCDLGYLIGNSVVRFGYLKEVMLLLDKIFSHVTRYVEMTERFFDIPEEYKYKLATSELTPSLLEKLQGKLLRIVVRNVKKIVSTIADLIYNTLSLPFSEQIRGQRYIVAKEVLSFIGVLLDSLPRTYVRSLKIVYEICGMFSRFYLNEFLNFSILLKNLIIELSYIGAFSDQYFIISLKKAILHILWQRDAATKTRKRMLYLLFLTIKMARQVFPREEARSFIEKLLIKIRGPTSSPTSPRECLTVLYRALKDLKKTTLKNLKINPITYYF